MTGSGVERSPRAATRPAHVRIGLRVLAVGGLAGAAWLLSAASAHAAEAALPTEDAPTDLSVVSLVDGSGESTVLSPLADTLDATLAATDLLSVGRASTVVLPSATAASSIPVTSQPAARPVGDRVGATRVAADEPVGAQAPAAQSRAVRDRAGSSDGVLLGTVRGLTTPLGLSGVLAGPTGLLTPLTRAVDPVVAPLDGVLRPVTGVLLTAAQPVTTALGSVTRAALGGDLAGQRGHDLIPGTTPASGAEAKPVRSGTAAALGARTVGLTGVSTVSLSGDRRYAGTELRSAGSPDERSGTGNLPDRHYPAPLRAFLGAGAGIPAGGPGSHLEGGGFAVVTSSVVESTVAFHRLPVTTDVAVLRLEAETPTVSPD
ncbi:hypothetical protein RB614_21030 [Phytohabitans sp. ZYX-F-186]|uniref:Uncharacterized protein n=1 Tax=Phytohabitans maris TaxID=3071409 RepID=A0ABU0ZJ10_9ACTN|nr:hypothetical protein [Phytohabitans sp. ZYX-F-186]MDQ7907000.1 hypothetical protein [Phytohabitans sp. ZYX-F-186]